MVFEGKKKYGYILIDGNNIDNRFGERVIKRIGNKFDDVELYSTDNHISNINPKGLNPVGDDTNSNEILNAIDDAVAMAFSNMENVSISFHSTKLHLRVADQGFVEKATGHVKNTMKRLKLSIFIMITALMVSVLIFVISLMYLG